MTDKAPERLVELPEKTREFLSKLSPDDITRLRTMLEERGTLFKIRVIHAGIQQEQQKQARSPETGVF